VDYGLVDQHLDGTFRAFVGDNLPESQRTLGFAMQSFLLEPVLSWVLRFLTFSRTGSISATPRPKASFQIL
jgi:hypothetical protein